MVFEVYCTYVNFRNLLHITFDQLSRDLLQVTVNIGTWENDHTFGIFFKKLNNVTTIRLVRTFKRRSIKIRMHVCTQLTGTYSNYVLCRQGCLHTLDIVGSGSASSWSIGTQCCVRNTRCGYTVHSSQPVLPGSEWEYPGSGRRTVWSVLWLIQGESWDVYSILQRFEILCLATFLMKVGTTFKAATWTLKFVTILTARTNLPLCNYLIKSCLY